MRSIRDIVLESLQPRMELPNTTVEILMGHGYSKDDINHLVDTMTVHQTAQLSNLVGKYRSAPPTEAENVLDEIVSFVDNMIGEEGVGESEEE
jgi:hypothetical protein